MNQFNVKNYTSSVPPARTAERIESFLAGAGATHISKRYDNGRITGIDFMIEAEPGVPLSFRLPVDVDAVRDHGATAQDAHDTDAAAQLERAGGAHGMALDARLG